MKIAVKSGDRFVCYKGRLAGERYVIKSKDGKLQRGAVIAMPYSDFVVKKTLLSNLSKKEMEKTSALQTAYNFPSPEWQYTSGYIAEGKSSLLFMTGCKTAPAGSFRAIVPDMIALYCIAARMGYADGGDSIIVYKDADYACCLNVAAGVPAFMREIQPDNISREIKLSSQDQYNFSDVRITDPKKIIMITDDRETYKSVRESFSCQTFLIILNDIVIVPNGRPKRDDVIASGMVSFFKYSKKLKGWNLNEGRYDAKKAVGRGVAYSLPLWIIFMYMMLSGDNRELQGQIDGIDGKQTALAPRYRMVADTQTEVTQMQSFMRDTGGTLNQNTDFISLTLFLLKNRADGMNIQSISGRFGGAVLITGNGKSYNDIADYSTKIKKYPMLRDVQLLFSEESENGRVDFQISMKLGKNEENQ